MILDPATVLISLSLDALLCAGIAAALARALPSASPALGRWSSSMLCFAASFSLLNYSGALAPMGSAWSRAIPEAFAAAGAAAALSACLWLEARSDSWRRLAGAAGAAGSACVAALAALAGALPSETSARLALALGFCSACSAAGALALIWRPLGRRLAGSLLASGSLLALCAVSAALTWTEAAGSGIGAAGSGIGRVDLAAHAIFFEASFLGASFAFVLRASELARERAQERSMRDPLTGLLNKRAFFESAEQALARAARDELPCAALMIDIDHFKRVNDRWGHLAGDAAIAHAASVVSRAMRGSDICARFGGEEFCALLVGADEAGARQVAQRVLDLARSEPASLVGHDGSRSEQALTVSIGARLQKARGPEDLAAMLSRADAALYQAKSAGRDRLQFEAEAS